LEAAFHRAGDAADEFVCPPCWQRGRPFLTKGRIAAFVAVIVTGLAVVALITLTDLPVVQAILVSVALYPVGVLLHELGHALSAFILGLRVGRISIGRYGPQFIGVRFFNCEIELRLIPYGGATVIWF